MDETKKEQMISVLDKVEEDLMQEDIYLKFGAIGHQKYICATKEGLIKLGIFLIKSAFSQNRMISLCSEDSWLDWVDPESEEAIDYIEIVDNNCIEEIKKSNEKRKLSVFESTILIFIVILVLIAIGLMPLLIIQLLEFLIEKFMV
ncbi:MAG TPA: hypothetical protein PLG49_01510 [Defluviitaleaceae bacterium]|nr:hypothetical protein [Defluviitaleaceae bacterium]